MSKHIESIVEVDSYDENISPLMHLKNPVSVQSLIEEGAEIELDDLNIATGEEIEEPLKGNANYSSAAFGVADEEDGEGLSPFDALRRKMVNLTEDGGVSKQLLQSGTGDVVTRGYLVYYHYSFFLEYADEPMDCSRLRDQKVKITLWKEGDTSCETIPGMDIALATMRKKEMARFLIEPQYAFGKRGVPPRIPENATIMAEVELLNFIDAGSAEAYLHLPAHERQEAPFEMCRKAVDNICSDGNDFFKQKQYERASKKYGLCIRLLTEARLADEKDEQQQQKSLLRNLINCALSHIKLKEWKRVISYANQASKVDPNHAKVLYLKGKALSNLNDFDRSRSCLLKARQLQPSDSSISKELEVLDQRMARVKVQEKVLCEKMFGNKAKDSTSEETTKAKHFSSAQKSKSLDIDPEYESVMRDLLRDFMDDAKQTSMPFPSNRLTPTELECARSVAKEMGLEVEERGEGSNFHLKIKKVLDN